MNRLLEKNPALTVEDFDHEIVMVNLHNGAYFSLKDSAAEIWRILDRNPDFPAFFTALGIKYRMDATTFSTVSAFLTTIVQEELARFSQPVPTEMISQTPANQPDTAVLLPPALEKFTNMQDILLLDPIHDVSDMGWPHQQ